LKPYALGMMTILTSIIAATVRYECRPLVLNIGISNVSKPYALRMMTILTSIIAATVRYECRPLVLVSFMLFS